MTVIPFVLETKLWRSEKRKGVSMFQLLTVTVLLMNEKVFFYNLLNMIKKNVHSDPFSGLLKMFFFIFV